MTNAPVYHHPPRKVSAGGWRRAFTLKYAENVFFVTATVFSFYIAFMIVRQGDTVVERVGWIILFWAVFAYLAMPRLNQIMTAIYVPDYFMGRTRAADGVLGDPVNLAVRGSEAAIHEVMQRAGWTLADPVTVRSSWGIIVSSLTRRSYPAAPVSPLFLFGRMHDFAYQQEVDGNASQRHHVRFFRCPPGWILPGGHSVDWLASGSYDRAVGLSLFTLQVTHKIDADIDVERDYIIATVRHAVPAVTVDVIEDFSTGYHSRNGGGDRVITDGNLPVLELGTVEVSHPQATPEKVRRRDVAARPPAVLLAAVLSVVSTVVSTGQGVYDLVTKDPVSYLSIDDPVVADRARTAAIVFLVVLAIALMSLAYQTYRGKAWARVAMLALAAATLWSHVGIGENDTTTLGDLVIDVAIMYALTSTSARQWTGDLRTRAPHAGEPPPAEESRVIPS